jgi:hypothetical protein
VRPPASGPGEADLPRGGALLRRHRLEAGRGRLQAALLRHVLVVSGDDALTEGLRAVAPPSTVFLTATGEDEALERLGRSSRLDAVVTDDPAVADAIREEIPGTLPVHVVAPGEEPAATWAALFERLVG